jgi:hypothetical protein
MLREEVWPVKLASSTITELREKEVKWLWLTSSDEVREYRN